MINQFQIQKLALNSLKEDINTYDLASESLFPDSHRSEGIFIAKEGGIVCGWEWVKAVFEALSFDGSIEIIKGDGEYVNPGDIIGRISGKTKALLMGERTSLNLLQHLSGISSNTYKAVSILKGSKTKLLDTRKTLPGLRLLQKYAVKTGGGVNHRYNLSQGAMLKDNHIKAAGSISKAYENLKENLGPMVAIEIEVSNLDELKEALSLNPNLIMLDNMDNETIKEAVQITENKVPLEASGNITLERLHSLKETEVDYISIGSLTHSVKALDISMKLM